MDPMIDEGVCGGFTTTFDLFLNPGGKARSWTDAGGYSFFFVESCTLI